MKNEKALNSRYVLGRHQNQHSNILKALKETRVSPGDQSLSQPAAPSNPTSHPKSSSSPLVGEFTWKLEHPAGGLDEFTVLKGVLAGGLCFELAEGGSLGFEFSFSRCSHTTVIAENLGSDFCCYDFKARFGVFGYWNPITTEGSGFRAKGYWSLIANIKH